ncbi:glycoside hydrolase family 9 protein [Kiritimatiellota bacterium B12222]|nr:glycoside hydrolase family 9 protein [Kiritimatiellota bacterium B12222]
MNSRIVCFVAFLCLMVSPVRLFGWEAFEDSDSSVLQSTLRPITASLLEVRLANRVLFDPGLQLRADMFRIYSSDDPHYAQGVSPVGISYWTRPVRYSIRKPVNLKHSSLFLDLPTPMQPGAVYRVEAPDVPFEVIRLEDGRLDREADGAMEALRVHYRGVWQQSPALHVNQAGYLPQFKKISYLSQYRGGSLEDKDVSLDVDFSEQSAFYVVDAETGKNYWEGKVRSASHSGDAVDPLTGTRMWELDFSAFQQPGRYRVFVPGVGVSFPFQIDSTAYNPVLGTLMRGSWMQRCGIALTAEWTRHTHPACHLDDAVIPTLASYNRDDLWFFPQAEGEKLSCAHGHHDAGDYGKYVTNGAAYAGLLLQAMEVYPERFQFDASPVPAAGNGIPDVLEEVKWELDWISGMQDPRDGGVHMIVKPHPTMSYEPGVAGMVTDPKFQSPRVVWWKDIPATASFAAVLAKASRSKEMQQLYPEETAQWVKQAEAAWAFCFLEVNEETGLPVRMVGGHHYGNFLNEVDDLCWAAVELWLATGKEAYHEFFLRNHRPKDGWRWGWWPLEEASGQATRAYALSPREGKNPEMLFECREGEYGLMGAARATQSWQDQWATRVSFSSEPWRFGRWGWYFLSDLASYDLLLAASIADPQEAQSFVQAALFNADQELGNHPGDVVSITGFGARRPVDHVHQLSRYDGIIEPVPGIPMGFHPAGYNRGSSDRKLMASFSYGEMPPAYRYTDSWNIEQEFTVKQLASTLATYAMLADTSRQLPGAPALQITGNGIQNKLSGPAPFDVEFDAVASGVSHKNIRSVLWDLDNEEFASDLRFTHRFETPGIYQVCCTVTDQDGWIRYEVITVMVTQPVAELPHLGRPLAVDDADVVALWRFDEGLLDEVNGLEAHLVGGAELSDENLMWMKSPAGKALRISNTEDGFEVKLPQGLLNDPAIQEFEVEAFINYQADTDRGSGHSKLFKIEVNWSQQLGIHKDTWAGKELKGVDHGSEELKKQFNALVQPGPGWTQIRLGFNRDRGEAWIGIHGEVLRFPAQFDESTSTNTLHIGGFVGYVDEVRIRVKEKVN